MKFIHFAVVDLKDKNLDFTLQNLEKQIAVSNTPSRITKLHHLNNGTQGELYIRSQEYRNQYESTARICL